MVRNGEVVENQGGILTIVFERPAACENCNGCLSKQCVNLEIAGTAAVGDTVEVELPDKSVVASSAIAYLLPLGMLLAGLLLGNPLRALLQISMNADLFAAAAGVVCLLIGVAIVYIIDRRLRNRRDWQPRIVAVHPHQEPAVRNK